MTSGSKKTRFLDAVARLATEQGVHVAIIGGAALQLLGSDRLTKDIEFASDRLIDGLAEQGSLEFGGIKATTSSGVPVDLVIRDDKYRALYEAAVDHATRVEGVPVFVVGGEYLIAMKMVAGRPKDDADLEFLIADGGMLDTEATPGLLSMFGIITGSVPSFHCFMPWRTLWDALVDEVNPSVPSPIEDAIFAASLRTSWGVLGLLAHDSQSWLIPASRHRRLLDSTLEVWPELDAVGERYAVGQHASTPVVGAEQPALRSCQLRRSIGDATGLRATQKALLFKILSMPATCRDRLGLLVAGRADAVTCRPDRREVRRMGIHRRIICMPSRRCSAAVS